MLSYIRGIGAVRKAMLQITEAIEQGFRRSGLFDMNEA